MTRVAIEKSNGHGKKSGEETAPVESSEGSRWAHPLQALREIVHWDELARALPGHHAEIPETGFVPDFDVRETADAYVFEADVPGIELGNLHVRVDKNRLSVRGARAEESVARGETVYARERFWGAFSRSFTLPDGVNVDAIEARLDSGVLTITIPKRPEARARRIPVK
jgi:HSP20 family protein